MPFCQLFYAFADYVITIWYSNPRVLISELIQSKSAFNQRCSSLKTECVRANKISVEQRWLRAYFLLNSAVKRWNSPFWTALIQRKSELISARLKRVLCISTEKRWKTSNLWNSAVQCWLSGTSIRENVKLIVNVANLPSLTDQETKQLLLFSA